MKLYHLIFILLSQIAFNNCQASVPEQVFIRTNQIGFLPDDLKTALVLSKTNLASKLFSIVDINSENIVYEEIINDSALAYGNFNFCYELDFSPVKEKGKYKIKILDIESYPFEIGESIYNSVRDSLSLFFKVQRCGPTNPLLHQPCHLSDAAKVIGYKDSTAKDLTGGWHDAGDYLKFLKTTAYTTYLLLFSYEFDYEKFSYDLDNNAVPDILEEAKVGLDWLLRCNIDSETLVSQVQNESDHDIGWRLPENDSLRFSRSGYVSLGKNTIGIYTAALALASRIWKQKYYDDRFADSCLSVAKRFYALRNDVQDIDSTFSTHYPEKNYSGRLALAAVELYLSTAQDKYLRDSFTYGEKAGSDFWWSVGDINSLAHYKIARFKPDFSKYIYQNLNHSLKMMESSILREGLEYTWGTTNAFLGISLQAILYKKISGSTQFDSLNIFQRDYILGKNPWGVSYIYNIGTNFSKNLHSQVAYFNKGYLPGGLAAGPAPLNVLSKYEIKRTNFSYDEFNSNKVKYYDDRLDYITNEPTIVGNATALFVFGYFSQSNLR